MKKRIATLFLAVIMLLTLAAPAFAESFSDVGSSMGTKYRDAINYMSDNGIMVGFEDGTFQPNTVLNRGMAVTILFRMSNDTNNTYSHSFTDVPSGSPYNNAIGWAKAKGICYGTTDTTFEPYVNVTKQQFITFLYRFAGYCNCSQATGNVSLDGFNDSSLLVGYAVNAFKWAYNYDLFDGGDFSSSYLDPLATVSRKNASLLCLNYRHNVEGIVHERDDFRFDNNCESFVSGSSMYLMSAADWALFEQTAVSKGFYDKYENLGTLNDIKNRPRGGSCFGMSVAVALDYSGKIDFNGNFCNNVSKMFDVPELTEINDSRHKPTTAVQNGAMISVAESKINFYQQSFLLTPIISWAASTNNSNNTELPAMIDGQEHGGIAIFNYTFMDGNQRKAHAINTYGVPEATDNGYRIKIYDNRYAEKQQQYDDYDAYINITVSSNSTYSAEVVNYYNNTLHSESVVQCKYINDFDVYENNGMDIDGENNTLSNVSSNGLILNSYDLLQVNAEDDYVITDANGNSLSVIGGNISGTMDVYRWTFLPTSPDSSPDYFFVVPRSSSYTCVASDDSLQYFYITNSSGTVGASNLDVVDQKLSSVELNNAGTVQLNRQNNIDIVGGSVK